MENRCNYMQFAYGVINKYQRFSITYFESIKVPVLKVSFSIAEKFIEYAKDNGELNSSLANAIPILRQNEKASLC